MDDQDRTRSGELSDEAWQLAVLYCVLKLHPERLSFAELRRQMFVDDQDFSQADAFDRAVCDLVAVGLLRHDGDSVIAPRAASYFSRMPW
jgi:hypothetical protein